MLDFSIISKSGVFKWWGHNSVVSNSRKMHPLCVFSNQLGKFKLDEKYKYRRDKEERINIKIKKSTIEPYSYAKWQFKKDWRQ